MRLTDQQWAVIANLLPRPHGKRRRGRPAADNRACVEGILWVLRNGTPWRELPKEYPSPSTCWRRLRQWEEQGVWLRAWRALLGTLDQRGLLRWEECFLDGTFFPAKKGASRWAKQSAARARNAWYWPMAKVFLWEFGSRLPRRTK